MAIENDFLVFAGAAGANVLTQANFAALPALANGYQSGILPSQDLNKNLRQSSIMAAVMAQFIVDASGQTVIDDGTTATILSNLQKSLAMFNVGIDTGAINAYAMALNPPIGAYIPGMVFNLEGVLNSNTGGSTVSINGLAAIPIVGPVGHALQGGELVATYGAILRINKLGTAAELVYTSGGATQVANAVSSGQAVALGQADGRYTPIAYSQFAGGISAATTLTAAQSGTNFYVNANTSTYNITLPALFPGMRYSFFGVGGAVVNLTVPAVSGNLLSPDGTVSSLAAGLTFTGANLADVGSSFDIISDGSNIFVKNTSGRVITKAATAANQAVNLGQFTTNQVLGVSLSQSLPGGLILKSGQFGTSLANTQYTITLPVAFPNNIFAILTSSVQGGTGTVSSWGNTLSTSQISICSSAPETIQWIVIGN